MRLFGKACCGAIAMALLTIVPAEAQSTKIAQIKTLRGDAFVVRGGTRYAVKIGDSLFETDVVETAANGAVGFTFVDNTVFSAGPESRIELQQFHFDSNNFKGEMQAEITKGSLTVVSGEITHSTPGAMKIKTPTTILGVRGTTFAVRVY